MILNIRFDLMMIKAEYHVLDGKMMTYYASDPTDLNQAGQYDSK